jgi:hypothetical protein
MSSEREPKRLRSPSATDREAELRELESQLTRAITAHDGALLSTLLQTHREQVAIALDRVFQRHGAPDVLVAGLVETTKGSFGFLNTVLENVSSEIRSHIVAKRRRTQADATWTEFMHAAQANTADSLQKCHRIMASDTNQGFLFAIRFWIAYGLRDVPATPHHITSFWAAFVKKEGHKRIFLERLATDTVIRDQVYSELQRVVDTPEGIQLKRLLCGWVREFERVMGTGTVGDGDSGEREVPPTWPHNAKLRALCCNEWEQGWLAPPSYCAEVIREYVASGKTGKDVVQQTALKYMEDGEYWGTFHRFFDTMDTRRSLIYTTDRVKDYNETFQLCARAHMNYMAIAHAANVASPTTPNYDLCWAVVRARDVILTNVVPTATYVHQPQGPGPVSEQLLAIRLTVQTKKQSLSNAIFQKIFWVLPFTSLDPATYAALLSRVLSVGNFVKNSYFRSIVMAQARGFPASMRAGYMAHVLSELAVLRPRVITRDTIAHVSSTSHSMPTILEIWDALQAIHARWSLLRRTWCLACTPGGRPMVPGGGAGAGAGTGAGAT